MAKVYLAPEEIKWKMPKNWGRDTLELSLKEYEDKLRKFIKENNPCKNPLVGEIVKKHVADGYACYMVANTKPLQLVHMDMLDGYWADEIWTRGLRLSDVKKMVEADKEMVKLFQNK